MNRFERRALRRAAGRFNEVPIDVVDFGDGTGELVIGGLSTCCCARCDMLRAYVALKSDGPPSAAARATRQFDHSRDEDRYDDHHS